MKVRPLGDRVLVQRLQGEQKSKGGIIIPDTAGEKPQEAKVIAVGPGRRTDSGELIKPSVKEGDRVLFAKYSGNEMKIDGTEQMFLRDEEILAILEG